MRILDFFFEAVWDVSILPLGSQSSFFATIYFDPEQNIMAIAAATIGAAVACVINWLIGLQIGKYLLKTQPSKKFLEFRSAFSEYGWPLLLLTWAPLGSFLPLLAGALGYKLKNSLFLSAGAHALFLYISVAYCSINTISKHLRLGSKSGISTAFKHVTLSSQTLRILKRHVFR